MLSGLMGELYPALMIKLSQLETVVWFRRIEGRSVIELIPIIFTLINSPII